MLDGSGVKTMPGLISAPNYGSLQKIRKIQVAKRGTPKNYKKNKLVIFSFSCSFLLKLDLPLVPTFSTHP